MTDTRRNWIGTVRIKQSFTSRHLTMQSRWKSKGECWTAQGRWWRYLLKTQLTQRHVQEAAVHQWHHTGQCRGGTGPVPHPLKASPAARSAGEKVTDCRHRNNKCDCKGWLRKGASKEQKSHRTNLPAQSGDCKYSPFPRPADSSH